MELTATYHRHRTSPLGQQVEADTVVDDAIQRRPDSGVARIWSHKQGGNSVTVNHSQISLQELVNGWPTAAPSSLLELANTSWHDLTEALANAELPTETTSAVKALYSHVKEVRVNSTAKSVGLHNLKAVHKALKEGMIRPSDGGWACYTLDEGGHRVPATNGRHRFKVHVFSSIPSEADLDKAGVTPPSGGSILLVHTGGPEVFTDAELKPGIETLMSDNVKVVDVLAYGDSPSGEGTGVWSYRSNVGVLNSGTNPTLDDELAKAMEEGQRLWAS